MLPAYIDESYDKVEYWLTALVVPADNALQLQNDLDAAVPDAARSYGVSPDAELHGSHIRGGKDDWTGMKEMIRAPIKVYSDALETIAFNLRCGLPRIRVSAMATTPARS